MGNTYYDFSVQTVVKATENMPRHSEASIIELNDGSLLMAWQRHEASTFGSGDQAPASIALLQSYDGGKTWENERTVAGMIEGAVNCYSPSFLRCSDGSITLFFKRYMHLVALEPILSNLYRLDSCDEGKTWGNEQLIWEMQRYSPMNDTVKRLASGAVLMPLTQSEGGWCGPDDHHLVFVLRSDNDMKTWKKSNVITVPMRGLMEPCIAQRVDGSLKMVMRTQLGSVFCSESLDDGRTWSKPQTTGLRAPESCPCIATIPNTDAQIVAWNNSEYDMNWRSHYGKRTPLTIAISRDGLRTFTDFCDVETDPNRAFTNPSFMFSSDGRCLMNYWTCPYMEDGRMGGLTDLKIASFRIRV